MMKMTLEQARSILLSGNAAMGDLLLAIGAIVSDRTSSLGDLILGLAHPDLIAEQASLSLFRRSKRPLPADRFRISTDPEDWVIWLLQNAAMEPAERLQVLLATSATLATRTHPEVVPKLNEALGLIAATMSAPSFDSSGAQDVNTVVGQSAPGWEIQDQASAQNADELRRIPVLPLPDAVLFPKQVMPLHIFEPRYRTLVTDALAGDKLIAVAMLRPGFEARYFTLAAPIHGIVGVGRIVAAEKLDDGKFNVLVRGESRAAILEEVHDGPYRIARLRALPPRRDIARHEPSSVRDRLQIAFRASNWASANVRESCDKLFDSSDSLGDLADILGGCIPAAGELRQRLLEETDVVERAQILLHHLEELNRASVPRKRSVAAARGPDATR
jgi:Lon protease-like protein